MLTARLLPAPLPAPTITDLAGLSGRHRRDRPSNQDEGGRTTRESARALWALHRVREACPEPGRPSQFRHRSLARSAPTSWWWTLAQTTPGIGSGRALWW